MGRVGGAEEGGRGADPSAPATAWRASLGVGVQEEGPLAGWVTGQRSDNGRRRTDRLGPHTQILKGLEISIKRNVHGFVQIHHNPNNNITANQ